MNAIAGSLVSLIENIYQLLLLLLFSKSGFPNEITRVPLISQKNLSISSYYVYIEIQLLFRIK